MESLKNQVGGDHYKTMAIQPAEYVLKNNIGWAEGCVITYLSRWQRKGGLQDLEKARHMLDMLIKSVVVVPKDTNPNPFYSSAGGGPGLVFSPPGPDHPGAKQSSMSLTDEEEAKMRYYDGFSRP